LSSSVDQARFSIPGSPKEKARDGFPCGL